MVTYLARSAWTSTSAGGRTLTGSKLRGVAVHWPGTAQAAIGESTQAATAARLRGYRDYHVNVKGWSDIGYNHAIDQAGRIWMCRTTQWRGNRVGAHCASATNQDANHEYVGVLLIIGQSETPSAKMIAAFRDWYHNRFLTGWPGRTDVRGHGQVQGAQTNCPGSRAKAAIPIMTTKPTSGSDDLDPEDDLNETQARQLADAARIAGDLESLLQPAVQDGRFMRVQAAIGRIEAAVAKQNPALTALQTLVQQNAVTLDQVLAAVDGADETAELRDALTHPPA